MAHHGAGGGTGRKQVKYKPLMVNRTCLRLAQRDLDRVSKKLRGPYSLQKITEARILVDNLWERIEDRLEQTEAKP